MLDAVGPITFILEEAVKGQLNQKSAIEAAQTAICLLGNASVNASRDRRNNALQSMNTCLLDNMADNNAIICCWQPHLSLGMASVRKPRKEMLKCLNMAAGRSTMGLPVFSRRPFSQAALWERPDLQRGLPKAAPLLPARQPVAQEA